ncbi:hypothetical protein HanRHA438_Chr12g0532911 [Helianthus annuus]|nr:hypothetical protein HanHA300_Chr12g0427311 [Helianthus annuus]KAJ0673406.1 hypothetical protein HanLR1_Chr12g0428891 [Helianthus annuus]KAJ0676760.1 hypothetical protein HanOQP8_Chr12g0429621 [Helianthus annuus]KAJ0815549.1 hypothetical protein HanLR1_Chr00c0739g0769561 [Helianthus annuus]KAJ0864717.1 hypothetical protein HanRHA438_Chr12g0532911 [Helianthus annuus]
MEQDPDSPPTFWFQPPRATNRRRTPPIDPVVLIILIPILALIFLFFFLPPFLSHFSHIISHISKPGSVKSTWDSLNIFLVLFAILCGVLARQNDDAPSSSTDVSNGFVTEGSSSSGQSSGQWTGFSDRKVVPGGLRRNSSSYPNLRNESVWESENRNQNRFFDDFNLYSSPANRYYNINNRTENLYGPVELSGDIHRRSRRSEADRVEFSDVKEIFVDTVEVSSNTPGFQQPPATPPPPPPPPPPPRSSPAANSKRHSFRSIAKNVTFDVPPETESDVFDEMRSYTPPPPPPPPPPPSTEVKVHRSRNKHKKLERKVSDATKEIATAISSLYNQRKRKSKRKLRDNSGSSDTSPPSVHSVRSETELISQQTPVPPPPPPPPPPPYRFQNLFKKGGKHKRIHSVPVTVSGRVPPPPPPPPPSSIFNNILKSVSKSKRFHSHSHSHSHSTAPPPPPLPPSSNTNRVSKTESKSKRFNSIFSQPPAPPPLPPPMTPPRYTVKSKEKASNRRNESKPPLPTKTSSYYDREEFLPSGSQSPLIPMPPPPPPFKMKAMKFELRGDFVRIQSTHSSVCSSPDRDVDISSLGMDGGDSIGPGSGLGLGSGPRFHPSPDVNAKAERFISRLKDEWRMEKKNYGKEKMG